MSLSPLKSCIGEFCKMSSTGPIFFEISLFQIKIFVILYSLWLRIQLASFSLVDFPNLNFTMDWHESNFEVFSRRDLICHSQKFQLCQTPVHVFAHISKIFYKYWMSIFFIEYLSSLRPVRTWCVFLSKTRPLHFSNI